MQKMRLTKLQRGPMMSLPTNCKAQIEISFKSIMLPESALLAKSIYARDRRRHKNV